MDVGFQLLFFTQQINQLLDEVKIVKAVAFLLVPRKEHESLSAHQPVGQTFLHDCELIRERNTIYIAAAQQLDDVVFKHGVVSLLG